MLYSKDELTHSVWVLIIIFIFVEYFHKHDNSINIIVFIEMNEHLSHFKQKKLSKEKLESNIVFDLIDLNTS